MMKTVVATFISVSWVLMLWAVVQPQDPYRSNGEAIYYTRTNRNGTEILFDKGPKWLISRKIGCVACHGAKGKGGYLIWPSLKIASDIRYDSLVKEEHLHGGKSETYPKYTDELIKRAVTRGINADGKPFDVVMPRWKLSDKDFVDLLDYLKQLGEGIPPPPEPFPREP